MNPYWIDSKSFRLATMARPRGEEWLTDDLASLKRAGVRVVVSALTAGEIEELGLMNEEGACIREGLSFRSFSIEDRMVPADLKTFAEFVDMLCLELRGGASIVIHCRAGIGRSSLIAACLLIRYGFAAEEALEMIEEARGYPVPDTPEQREWIKQFQ